MLGTLIILARDTNDGTAVDRHPQRRADLGHPIVRVCNHLWGGPKHNRRRRERVGTLATEEYGRAVTSTLRRELKANGVDPDGVRLQLEPGRSLYGNTGIHLSTVKTVKRQTKPIPYTWVLTDTTYFFLAGGVLEHNRHPFVFVSQPDAPATQTADIVGHSCYADQIVLGAKVPDVQDGEVVALLETGAYQESSASNFNSLPRPASVLVHGDQAELIKRAENVGDVYGRDVIPERLIGKPAEAK